MSAETDSPPADRPLGPDGDERWHVQQNLQRLVAEKLELQEELELAQQQRAALSTAAVIAHQQVEAGRRDAAQAEAKRQAQIAKTKANQAKQKQ